MRTLSHYALLLLYLMPYFSACKNPVQQPNAPKAEFKKTTPPLEFIRVGKNTWLHKSYDHVDGYGMVYSHGGIIQSDDGVIVVDSAWTVEQTKSILLWIEKHLKGKVEKAVFTHFHRDKMGGIEAFIDAGINTYASHDTNTEAQKRGMVSAEFELTMKSNIALWNDGRVEIFYPGPGHTQDNLVVYSKSDGVLLGGCIVRPGASKNMGNTSDANLGEWPNSIRRIQEKYQNALVVVPSHGPPGSLDLLVHTLRLAIEYEPTH